MALITPDFLKTHFRCADSQFGALLLQAGDDLLTEVAAIINKIRVLIAEDHAAVRQGLRSLLELHDDIEVVGEASNGLEAVDLARGSQPDIVLMDLAMPELDGIGATQRIRAICPSTQVIVLTSFSEDQQVRYAVKAGAMSYLQKNVYPADLIKAIQAAYRRCQPK